LQLNTKTISVFAALMLTLAPASANSVLKQSVKLHRDGMVLWRNGDFLGAFGSCFGAKQVLRGLKGVKPELVAEALGYAELCIGLSLQQMKVKGGPYNACKSYVATKKQFAIVDAARKSRGETLADGGYMDEQLKEAKCK
jgi:hypothetical protein